jgi:chemosensory pili system protein ChpC
VAMIPDLEWIETELLSLLDADELAGLTESVELSESSDAED